MILALFVAPAAADYSAPPPDEMIAAATSILYATVTAYDARGSAQLDIHEVVSGARVDHIDGVWLTCMGGSPELYGLKAGERYLILLHGDDLFEERSYFAVRGDLEVEFYAGSDGYQRSWQPMPSVRKRILALR